MTHKPMNLCLALAVIQEGQVETKWDATSHLLRQPQEPLFMEDKTRAGEDVEKLESSYIADGNINWCSHFGRQFDTSSNS